MERAHLSRREFVRLSGLAGAGAILAACAPKVIEVTKEVPVEVTREVPVEVTVETVVEVPAEIEKTVIEWWWIWGGVNGLEGLKSLSEGFNAQSDTVAVRSLVPANMIEKYTTAVAAGTPPDLAVGVHSAFPELAARGALLALDDFLAASTVIDLDDFFPGLMDSNKWMGKTYGIQCAENGPRQGLMYNLDLVEAAGLDPSKPPQTVDELFAWHQAITKFDEAGNVEILGLDPLDAMGGRLPTADAELLWAGTFGFTYWNQYELTFSFDQPLFVEYLATIKRFYDSVGVTNMEGYRASYGTWTASPQASFPAGVEGMILDGYWSPPWMMSNGPEVRFDVTWPPVSEERRGVKFQNVGGHQGIIAKGSKHPEAAFQLIEYLTTDPASDINWEFTGFFSPRRSWVQSRKESIIAKVPQEEFFIRSMFEADEMQPSPLCPINEFMVQEWNKAISATNYGEKSPEQAAKDLQEAVTREMDRERPGFIVD